MPAKQKTKKAYHKGHHKEKHTKHFVKVYAPYLPLILIVLTGLFLSFQGGLKQWHGDVLSYATDTTSDGLLQATNRERTNNGLSSLTTSPILSKAAQEKANDMAARNYWSHNTPDGKEPWFFMEQAGYHYLKAAENLAYGFQTSDSTVSGWMNSPSHRANVLDGELQEVGFGIVNVPSYQNQGPETIVVAMYGKPAVLPATTADTGAAPATQTNAPSAKKITYAQTLTGGSAPWIALVSGVIIGIVATYLVLKYTRRMHHVVKRGERFIIHHPLLDTTLVALLALAAVASQTAGSIH